MSRVLLLIGALAERRKVIVAVEQHVRTLSAPHRCAEVFAGVAHQDGERVVTAKPKSSSESPTKAAA